MIVHTAQIRIVHPARLDITRSGVDRALRAGQRPVGAFLAPSRDLLDWGLRERARAKTLGEGYPHPVDVAFGLYKARYLEEVDENIAQDRGPLDVLLTAPEVVLVCFCGGEDAKRGHCHRFVAASILVAFGATRGPELTPAAPIQAATSKQLGLFGGGK